MLNFVKNIPLAMSGLVLGTAALANLLGAVWPNLRLWVLSLAFIIFGLLFARLILTTKNLRQEFSSPVVASSFSTVLMAMAIFSSGFAWPNGLGRLFWWLIFLAYLVYILVFTLRFAPRKDLSLLYPSWFIVYVGIAMLSVTAPAFGEVGVGWLAFYIAVAGYVIVVPSVLYRLFKLGLPDQFRPTLVILAAPTSLLLTAYVTLAQKPSLLLVAGLAFLAQAIYWTVICLLPKLVARDFSPLCACFTFPLVSTAIGLRLTLTKLGLTNPFFNALAYVELLIGLVIVVYVLAGYTKFLMVSD